MIGGVGSLRAVPRARWIIWGLLLMAAVTSGLYVRWRSNRLVARMTADVQRPVDTSDGILIIAGGGMLPRNIKERFWNLAGDATSRIVVIPGSPLEPARLATHEERWDDFETTSMTVLQAASRAEADDPNFSRALDSATGVWLGGGQQSWVAARYRGTLVHEKLKQVLDRGGVIGGTSAGAAIMSDVMIAGGKREPVADRGFGFFPEGIIDQHFLKRNRMTRLCRMLAEQPTLIGFGVDERTALIVERKGWRLSVIGDSYVTACVPGPRDEPFRFEFLKAGDQTDLHSLHHPEIPAESPWDLDAILAGED